MKFRFLLALLIATNIFTGVMAYLHYKERIAFEALVETLEHVNQEQQQKNHVLEEALKTEKSKGLLKE